MRVKAVIMAGGKGTRFWPYSRSHFPKQFLSIRHEGTLLQNTVKRLRLFLPVEDIYVTSLHSYIPHLRKQLPMIPEKNLIAEPVAKDTAACIGFSALRLMEEEDSVLITLPSDHYISDPEIYCQALQAAVHRAQQETCVVTIGVKPTRPETEYGYIRVSQKTACDDNEIMPVQQFIEKPRISVAQNIFVDGQHYWNTGAFIWKISTIFQLLKSHMPNLYEKLLQIKEVIGQKMDYNQFYNIYSEIEKQSVDFGIIEKCRSIYMVPVQCGWDDLGIWDALERTNEKDHLQNIVFGLHEGIDTKNNVIYGESDQLVATIGIEDLLIVSTKDALLVCSKDRTKDIKKLYELLDQKGYKKYL
ncbi:NTP transferase domain-containing protein [Paenibacillus alkaliterrae]|uniref:mannose-1-phosphate guanylyltransferase n=1 Tax=Paenibacillus alkaliterrae TaxID=320909 RepID=UPI001F1FCD8A|nr:sugar phosphate nucleotidyltransferase [Paenibacillus alkaliterrae]MCF2941693.1 NTP transferase domain-containing protein [Paenibacillus alkaliterrae]